MKSLVRTILISATFTNCLLSAASLGAQPAPTIEIEIQNSNGRRVFQATETLLVQCRLENTGANDTLGARLESTTCEFARPLGTQPVRTRTVNWTVKLAHYKPGPYEFSVTLLSDQQKTTTAELRFYVVERPTRLDFFPVEAQFSPVPSGKGWTSVEQPLTPQLIRETIDNIIDHGFTGLEAPVRLGKDHQTTILNYAQSRGMFITYHTGSLELFGRDKPPEICVYSPQYPGAVRRNAEKRLAPLKNIPRLYNVFTYQDEPFHGGPQSFGYNKYVGAEFKKRYGYELPPDIESIRSNPEKWLDVINFRTDYFPDGWRQVYKIIKQIDPSFKVTLTHDSHNSFCGGCGSHAQLAIDEVFHWNADFADMFVYDIYPYMMSFDFRFGLPAKLLKPRIAQTHYTFAQMRNLTSTYQKDLGFWVGTFNHQSGWFAGILNEKLKAKHWAEREMSTTAVAAGANYLLTGLFIPDDPDHWQSFGQGLRLIQKAGPKLLKAPKVKAKACMLLPRTQYIQLQQEYFNVSLSFELFLRAFGELDILHEEQITDDRLNGCDILLAFDVRLLPRNVADHITAWVRNGGLLIADCVPIMDSYKRPIETFEQLFGVTNPQTNRIPRTGHWVPKTENPYWVFRPKDAPDESVFKTDQLEATILGNRLNLTLVSPRPCTPTTAAVLAATTSGKPALTHRKVGKGQVYLLGFCLQDTYFKTWQDKNPAARAQLRNLLNAITTAANIRPHVHCSNPDIEAALRASDTEAFLFVINHEAANPDSIIQIADLKFPVTYLVNLADEKPVAFTRHSGCIQLQTSLPIGQTQIIHLLSHERPGP